MKFNAKSISGSYSIDLEPFRDDRGSFARAFCQAEFAANGLPTTFEQMNLSRNPDKHTFRGFHYQMPPHEEGKLIRCVKGRILDLAIDIRPNSPTFGICEAVEVSAESGNMFYVPAGCAHAFLTLEDNCDVLYMATRSYAPGVERGICWKDDSFDIDLPAQPALISEKDTSWPAFDADRHRQEWEASQ